MAEMAERVRGDALDGCARRYSSKADENRYEVNECMNERQIRGGRRRGGGRREEEAECRWTERDKAVAGREPLDAAMDLILSL